MAAALSKLDWKEVAGKHFRQRSRFEKDFLEDAEVVAEGYRKHEEDVDSDMNECIFDVGHKLTCQEVSRNIYPVPKDPAYI